MPGCMTKFAMLVTGSSQPKYSKSRKYSFPVRSPQALCAPRIGWDQGAAFRAISR